MELLIWFAGCGTGLTLGYLIFSPKKKPSWNPNDYTIPKPLPMIDLSGINRSFDVVGNSVTQIWEFKGIVSQSRTITKHRSVLTQEEFLKLWHQNELNFYLKNKELFDEESKKCLN